MENRKQLKWCWWAGCLCLALTLACGCRCRSKTDATARASEALPSAASATQAEPRDGSSEPRAEHSLEPTALLTLKESAYHAKIAMDEEAVYLLTSRAAYRVVPGSKAEETPLDLGFGATLTTESLLYWSRGAVWRAPKSGGKPRRMVAVAHQPQYLIASGEQFAWVDRSEAGQFTVRALGTDGPTVIYSSPGSIDAAAMARDTAFFVERNKATWRIGRVPSAGGAAAFTADRPGRSPSMLAAGRDGIYYYDGNQRQVRRLTKDRQDEEVVANGVICSPLAVSDAVYCGHVQGLFEVSLDKRKPRRVTDNHGNLVTAIAAGPAGVAWISDTGEEQLAVRMLPRVAP